jgi:hypothetical protein
MTKTGIEMGRWDCERVMERVAFGRCVAVRRRPESGAGGRKAEGGESKKTAGRHRRDGTMWGGRTIALR